MSTDPVFNQPLIKIAEDENEYRTWYEDVTGPVDAMIPGTVVVAESRNDAILVLLNSVTVDGDSATCTDYTLLRCINHISEFMRIRDDDTRKFLGLHTVCFSCNAMRPYCADMTLEEMGARL